MPTGHQALSSSVPHGCETVSTQDQQTGRGNSNVGFFPLNTVRLLTETASRYSATNYEVIRNRCLYLPCCFGYSSYLFQIQVVLDRENVIAKQHLAAGQKDRALIALRRRKYQQSLLVKTDTQLETLEQLVSTIEYSLVEISVMHGISQGTEVLKEIHKELNVETVEQLLSETQEAQAYQQVPFSFNK